MQWLQQCLISPSFLSKNLGRKSFHVLRLCRLAGIGWIGSTDDRRSWPDLRSVEGTRYSVIHIRKRLIFRHRSYCFNAVFGTRHCQHSATRLSRFTETGWILMVDHYASSFIRVRPSRGGVPAVNQSLCLRRVLPNSDVTGRHWTVGRYDCRRYDAIRIKCLGLLLHTPTMRSLQGVNVVDRTKIRPRLTDSRVMVVLVRNVVDGRRTYGYRPADVAILTGGHHRRQRRRHGFAFGFRSRGRARTRADHRRRDRRLVRPGRVL